MKRFVCTCCNIYSKIINELLVEIKNKNNIKSIVKRKAELRVKDINRLLDYFKKGQVISYMSEIRTVEEGIYHLLALQINEEYEKEYVKIKPKIEKNPREYLCEIGVLDNTNNLIRDEYNYFCKYAHAGEMYDLLLTMCNDKITKSIMNNFLSCCISIIASDLIYAFCKLLNIDEIKIAELTACMHIFSSIIYIVKDKEIFHEYQKKLEYDFEIVNIEHIGYISESMKQDILLSQELENLDMKENIKILNKDLCMELQKYSIKKEKIEYITKFFVNTKKYLEYINHIPQEELLKWLEININRKNELKKITYPKNKETKNKKALSRY